VDKVLRWRSAACLALKRAAPAARSVWWKDDTVLLTGLTLLSLSLRIAWAVTRNVVIDNEGAEYTRIAVNLAADNGYVGLMGGPQLVDSPLYPLLIRTGLFFTHSAVASARAVSIAAGTLLVPLVFLIALSAYGRRPAWVAAVITGLHPFLIGFSASTYADFLYPTLLGFSSGFGFPHQGRDDRRNSRVAGANLRCRGLETSPQVRTFERGARFGVLRSVCQPLRSIPIPTRASFAA